MFKKLPSLSHLKVFGYRAYPLILNKKRDKFEPTSQADCVLAGYDERKGIYWIYNRSKRSMFRSRDVKFNEQLFVTKENKSEVIEEEFNNSTNLMSDTEDQIEDQVEDQVDD